MKKQKGKKTGIKVVKKKEFDIFNLSQKMKLWMEQNARCYYCGKVMSTPHSKSSLSVHKNNDCTLEHIFPKTDMRRYCVGGEEQVAAACAECNHRKGYEDGRVMVVDYTKEEIKKYDRLLLNILIYGEQILVGY